MLNDLTSPFPSNASSSISLSLFSSSPAIRIHAASCVPYDWDCMYLVVHCVLVYSLMMDDWRSEEGGPGTTVIDLTRALG